MRTFKTRAFARFADREGMPDAALCSGRAARSEGPDRCRLGGRCHQAAHRPEGRRPVRWVPHDRAVPPGRAGVFVYGFAKSGRENLRRDELETFRRLAGECLALDAAGLAAAQAVGAIIEVECDDQAVQE